MRWHEILVENDSNGTFMAWEVDDETDEYLNKWLDKNGFPELDTNFHATIVYSEKSVPNVARGDIDPIGVDDFEFELLGEDEDSLVLRFDCPEMEERHNFIRDEYGATHSYPTYKSHVTLCYDVNEIDNFDIDSYNLPDCSLVFDHEYQEELEDDDD